MSLESCANDNVKLLAASTCLLPHHPDVNSIPPYISGKRPFKFQVKWFQEYPWLHFENGSMSATCFTCRTSLEKRLIPNLQRYSNEITSSFVSDTGFSNWKKGTERLMAHQNSSLHKECAVKTASLKATPVSCQLNKAHATQQMAARTSLKKIFSSLQYLGRQGLAFRGHTEEKGNLSQLNKLRASDVPELAEFLKRKEHYTSHDIQNEMSEIMSHMILRDIVAKVKSCGLFSLIVDESCDVSCKEQVSISLRIVENFQPQELFLGLYETSSTTGLELSKIINDVFTRFGLSFSDLRGQCYDGASNMKGKFKGLKTILQKQQPLAVYVHCGNHSLNLALQDCVKSIPLFRDALQTTNDIGVLLQSSPKRKALFTNICQDEVPGVNSSPRPLCPTRWTVRVRSISGILKSYSSVIEFLDQLDSDSDTTLGSKAKGLREQLEKGSMYLALLICCKIFQVTEKLSFLLQKPTLSVSAARESVQLVIVNLRSMRTEESFEQVWSQMSNDIDKYDLVEPQLPRVRKVPKKLEQTATPSTSHKWDSPKDMLRATYFAGLDGITGEIEERFNQPGFAAYDNLEKLLNSKVEDWTDEMKNEAAKRGVCVKDLQTELEFLFRTIPSQNLNSLVDKMKMLQPDSRLLFTNVDRLIQNLLVVPISSATAERSFSLLRRVKCYLRSTMSQVRLNHLCIMSTYQEELDNLDLDKAIELFINSEHRFKIFGNI